MHALLYGSSVWKDEHFIHDQNELFKNNSAEAEFSN